VKNTPQNNFLTNGLISTNILPIHSVRQAETLRNFKFFSKFVSGEQSGYFREKSNRLNNFSTVQSIFTKQCTDRFISTQTSQNSKYFWQKTAQFKISCNDSKKLQESWNDKTVKNTQIKNYSAAVQQIANFESNMHNELSELMSVACIAL
jgi:hypothetical protein